MSGCVREREREYMYVTKSELINPVWTLPVLWIELFCYNYGISKQLNCILLCFSIQRLDACNSTIIPSMFLSHIPYMISGVSHVCMYDSVLQ